MTGALHKWMVAGIAGVSLAIVAGLASAAELAVTDADRTWRNYTRENATVGEHQFRLEVRGFDEQDDHNARLNVIGFPTHCTDPTLGPCQRNLSAGIIDLVASYGFAKNAEAGLIIPGLLQSFKVSQMDQQGNTVSTSSQNAGDVGDLLLYGKFKRQVAEHCSVGAGMEVTLPNGPKDKGMGTGNSSFNPVVSSRYQQGRLAAGVNTGYQIYTGSTPDVYNYGAEVIVRGNEIFAIRTEIYGRLFNENGIHYNDLSVLPGLDIAIAENLVVRPEGMAGVTGPSIGYGIGVGFAATF